MKIFTLYLGLNDKDSKRQEIETLAAYKIVSNLISSRFGGGTIFANDVIYKHNDGSFVVEKTLRIELQSVERSQVQDFVTSLKEIFNKESIVVQEKDMNSE